MLVDGARVRWKAFPDWEGHIYRVNLQHDVPLGPYTGFMMVHQNVPWSAELKRQLETSKNLQDYLTVKKQLETRMGLTYFRDQEVNPLLFLNREEDIEVIGLPKPKCRRGKKHKMHSPPLYDVGEEVGYEATS